MSEPRGQRRAPTYSDDDVLAGLRQAAAECGEPLTAGRYDAYAGGHGLVSTARVIQRLGTWNQACLAAGLEVNRGRTTYAKRWTEAELAGHVADYLQSDGATGSYVGYAGHARAVDGAPSAQTVRNAFGGWASAKAAGQQVVERRARA
jgi:hypothetical protein